MSSDSAACLACDPTQDDAESWGSCRGTRVLVVDDDPDMRALLASRLERAGCIAHEAASGIDAQAILASRGPQEDVDLLLIDLRMPGSSGIQILRALRAARQLPPAILMTAFAEPEVHAEALALGIHILDKPFPFDTLRRLATALILSSRVERKRDGGCLVHHARDEPSRPLHLRTPVNR
jgi:two-component system, response regulator, stage 0 sporulation protein F